MEAVKFAPDPIPPKILAIKLKTINSYKFSTKSRYPKMII